MEKVRVAVLMGGTSSEREVSLSSGRQVLSALDPERYDAFSVDTACLALQPPKDPALPPSTAEPHRRGDLTPITARMGAESLDGLPVPAELPLIGRNRPDVVLICLHGRHGEDGTIQGLLELLGIPYTGSGVLASALAMDKAMSKKLFEYEGIPTPPSVLLKGRADAERYLRELEAGTARVTCPAVVKPSRQGSTIGISIARDPSEMGAALHTAFAYDTEVLVEKQVIGIEITAPILGNEELTCLPLVEIVPAGGFYDYEAKYTPGATEEIVPARITPEQTREAQELAVRSHRALGCRGVSRTDMIVAEDGVWVLEVNTIPGMTPTSLLPRAAEAMGISFSELLDRMIQLALEGQSCESPSAV